MADINPGNHDSVWKEFLQLVIGAAVALMLATTKRAQTWWKKWVDRRIELERMKKDMADMAEKISKMAATQNDFSETIREAVSDVRVLAEKYEIVANAADETRRQTYELARECAELAGRLKR